MHVCVQVGGMVGTRCEGYLRQVLCIDGPCYVRVEKSWGVQTEWTYRGLGVGTLECSVCTGGLRTTACMEKLWALFGPRGQAARRLATLLSPLGVLESACRKHLTLF